mmetsp:Transcript_33755/g.85422  ORF Transcript_33755/g.85422 Transcript_33755/m.85422 type:complete len:1314 (-) Transcript_33755:702-4643(-)
MPPRPRPLNYPPPGFPAHFKKFWSWAEEFEGGDDGTPQSLGLSDADAKDLIRVAGLLPFFYDEDHSLVPDAACQVLLSMDAATLAAHAQGIVDLYKLDLHQALEANDYDTEPFYKAVTRLVHKGGMAAVQALLALLHATKLDGTPAKSLWLQAWSECIPRIFGPPASGEAGAPGWEAEPAGAARAMRDALSEGLAQWAVKEGKRLKGKDLSDYDDLDGPRGWGDAVVGALLGLHTPGGNPPEYPLSVKHDDMVWCMGRDARLSLGYYHWHDPAKAVAGARAWRPMQLPEHVLAGVRALHESDIPTNMHFGDYCDIMEALQGPDGVDPWSDTKLVEHAVVSQWMEFASGKEEEEEGDEGDNGGYGRLPEPGPRLRRLRLRRWYHNTASVDRDPGAAHIAVLGTTPMRVGKGEDKGRAVPAPLFVAGEGVTEAGEVPYARSGLEVLAGAVQPGQGAGSYPLGASPDDLLRPPVIKAKRAGMVEDDVFGGLMPAAEEKRVIDADSVPESQAMAVGAACSVFYLQVLCHSEFMAHLKRPEVQRAVAQHGPGAAAATCGRQIELSLEGALSWLDTTCALFTPSHRQYKPVLFDKAWQLRSFVHALGPAATLHPLMAYKVVCALDAVLRHPPHAKLIVQDKGEREFLAQSLCTFLDTLQPESLPAAEPFPAPPAAMVANGYSGPRGAWRWSRDMCDLAAMAVQVAVGVMTGASQGVVLTRMPGRRPGGGSSSSRAVQQLVRGHNAASEKIRAASAELWQGLAGHVLPLLQHGAVGLREVVLSFIDFGARGDDLAAAACLEGRGSKLLVGELKAAVEWARSAEPDARTHAMRSYYTALLRIMDSFAAKADLGHDSEGVNTYEVGGAALALMKGGAVRELYRLALLGDKEPALARGAAEVLGEMTRAYDCRTLLLQFESDQTTAPGSASTAAASNTSLLQLLASTDDPVLASHLMFVVTHLMWDEPWRRRLQAMEPPMEVIGSRWARFVWRAFPTAVASGREVDQQLLAKYLAADMAHKGKHRHYRVKIPRDSPRVGELSLLSRCLILMGGSIAGIATPDARGSAAWDEEQESACWRRALSCPGMLELAISLMDHPWYHVAAAACMVAVHCVAKGPACMAMLRDKAPSAPGLLDGLYFNVFDRRFDSPTDKQDLQIRVMMFYQALQEPRVMAVWREDIAAAAKGGNVLCETALQGSIGSAAGSGPVRSRGPGGPRPRAGRGGAGSSRRGGGGSGGVGGSAPTARAHPVQQGPNYAPSGVLRKCAACAKTEAASGDFKRCSQCKSVWYCDKECQKGHWKAHKKECAALAKKAQEEEEGEEDE